ncbi:MAG: ABC transporter ATP-binding protein [Archangium sp.]|nr:ABC transporter ATP-binding protein [Archangium sp.]
MSEAAPATLKGTVPDPSLPRVLDVVNLGVDVDDRTLIDGITFYIPKGEFVCLCGPNGAGKSTFLKSTLGLMKRTRGEIKVNGKPLEEARGAIGYVPQRKTFAQDFPATAVELIVANLRGKWPLRVHADEREKARLALVKTGGEKLIDKPLAGLSGGETQRVFLARAMVTQPELLVLDEPTAGVDVKGRAEFLELLAGISKSDHIAAILVTHNVAAVTRTAERIVYLEAGRLVAWGLPDELLGHDRLTALAFAPPQDHKAAPDED